MKDKGKDGIELLLKEIVVKTKAARALIMQHDGQCEARFAIGEEPEDYIATGGQYRNEERLNSAVRDLETVLERVQELREKGFK